MNYVNHLEKLKECDWIIEAISERLDWKQDLYNKIIPFLEPSTDSISSHFNVNDLGIICLR